MIRVKRERGEKEGGRKWPSNASNGPEAFELGDRESIHFDRVEKR